MDDRTQPTILLEPLRETDFATIAEVASAIWLAHYSTIITREQIEYMLTGRFTPANLCRYIDSNERWFDVLRASDALVGYCSYALTSQPRELKLEQLYLMLALHGRGFGQLMLNHVERRAIEMGCHVLMLQVNKHNQTAIKVYDRSGFTVRQEVVVDIGQGFVMDDFIMEKRVSE